MQRCSSRWIVVGAILAFPVLLAMRAPEEQMVSRGQELFVKNCKRCHGDDGSRGFLGAKDLRTSRLADDSIQLTILNGRKVMPSFKEKLTPEDITQVMLYVKGLRR